MFEKQQERQYDDTLQGQQGVVDNSKAMQTQAITSGIQGLAGAVDTGVDIWQTEQKQQQAQASNSALNSYGNWLEKEVQMKEQGIDPKVIDAERVKTEQQLMVDGAGRDDLLKLRKQFEGTSLGKSLTEKTPEEKAYEKDAEEAARLNMPVETYRHRQRVLSDFAADVATGTEDAVKSMTKYNQVSFDALKSQTDSIIMDFQSDNNRVVAEQRLREVKANIQREAAGWTSGTDISPAQAEAIIKPNLVYVDYILNDLTAEGFAQKAEDNARILKIQNKLQLYQNNPDLISYETNSEIAKNSPTLQLALANQAMPMFESIVKGSKEGSPKQLDSMLVTSTPASKEVLKTIKKIVTDPDAPQETKKELSAGVVKGIATQLGENLDLSDSKSTMEFVASEAGKELYKNKDNYPEYAEYETKIKNHANATYQKVSARLDEIVADNTGIKGEKGDLVLDLKGSTVVFTGTSVGSNRKAKSLNRELSKVMSVFVLATANAQGISAQESFDQMIASDLAFSKFVESEQRTMANTVGSLEEAPEKTSPKTKGSRRGGGKMSLQELVGGLQLTKEQQALASNLISGGDLSEFILEEGEEPAPVAQVDPDAPRGIRNNNPGNIESGDDWEGLSKAQKDGRFAQFDSPEAGIRAIAKTLNTYKAKHKLDTIDGIINRWAPDDENDTESYIQSVERSTGFNRDETIEVKDYPALIKAIIKHENGQMPYDESTILEGVKLANLS